MKTKLIEKEFTAHLDKVLYNNLRYFKKIRKFHVYRIGGPYFGPHGGPGFWGQYFIFSTIPLNEHSDKNYLCQLIAKSTPTYSTEYLFLQPTSQEPKFTLCLQFTTKWRWIRKSSLWYCLTEENPLPQEAEIIFKGGSSSLQARQGSEWALFVLPLSSSNL